VGIKEMTNEVAFTLVCGSFLFALVMGVPIGFCMMGTGILGFIILSGSLDVGIMLLPRMLVTLIANVPLMVIPMFILAGCLANAAGITEKAFDAVNRWTGRLPGGLALTTVGACSVFAATSGSSVATTIAIGKLCIPEMKRLGYSDALAAGVAASGGLLGIMIPPSIPMVIYGVATETSIGQLLIGGIFPGILTGVVFSIGIIGVSFFSSSLAPTGRSYSVTEKINSLKNLWPVILLFVIIIGGIYSGVFSPSEAGAAAAFVGLLMCLIMREKGQRFQRIKAAISEAVPAFLGVYLILVGGLIFSSFITRTGIPSKIANGLVDLGLGAYPTLLLIILSYIPLGMFLDPVSMFLITLPFFFPAVTALGFHPVWFGVIIVKTIEIANLTPPIGMNVFAANTVAPDIPLMTIFRGALFFIALEILVIMPLLIIFPMISLYLPLRM
jgi:tripartite ATP-independent transporter DctM subunit